MPDKPRHRSGYSAAETELVRSACLTVAATLGAFMEDLVVVGGLVPSLLVDTEREAEADEWEPHPGTNDLDLGLSLALLDEQRYAELSARLRSEGFKSDVNDAGNPTAQRWVRDGLKVDFLIPSPPGSEPKLRLQNLETDFGALVTPGLELAFDERVWIAIHGFTLQGQLIERRVPVCGPGAFVVLKSLAFGDRIEPKDAYDLVYVVRGATGGAEAVASRLREHAARHAAIVKQALGVLRRDFATIDHVGPQRAAEFAYLEQSERDNAAADAHGVVDDLLRAFAK